MYLFHLMPYQNHDIKFEQWEDNDFYHEDVSFCMKPSFAGGDGQVSFESVNMFNKYLTTDNEVDLKLLHVGNDFGSKGIASFSVEYLPCNSRRLRGDRGPPALISVW